MEQLMDRGSWCLLTLLIAADLAFITLGIIYECEFIDWIDVCASFNFDSYFSLTRDRGYAEVFQYIKEFWLIILFGFISISRGLKTYLGWFFLSIFLLLDDALEIHEKIGAAIAQKFGFISLFNIRPVDYGELAFFGAVGITFFCWLRFSYMASNSKERTNLRSLIKILLGLAFFGVVVDLIHIIVESNVFLNSCLAVIEDGGEHIFMSLLVVCVWTIFNNHSFKLSPKI